MSYFPEDIPFMSEEERKANGIKTAKEIETQKTQLSKEDATFDCVSRQRVIERIEWWFEILKQNPDILIDAIKTLPPAQPEPDRGEWLPDNNNYYEERFICSVCGRSYKVDTCMGKPMWDFCPCGADMRGKNNGKTT